MADVDMTRLLKLRDQAQDAINRPHVSGEDRAFMSAADMVVLSPEIFVPMVDALGRIAEDPKRGFKDYFARQFSPSGARVEVSWEAFEKMLAHAYAAGGAGHLEAAARAVDAAADVNLLATTKQRRLRAALADLRAALADLRAALAPVPESGE